MSAFLERYSDKIHQVSESGCMIWMGATYRHGYGAVTDGAGKSPTGAHRASFAAKHGAIPAGRHVLHRCDVRSCVNPDHLFLGDQSVNMADMASKGRSCIGSRHGRATMTEEVVLKMRAEYRPRIVTAAALAERYGVTVTAAKAAISGQSFKYLEKAK